MNRNFVTRVLANLVFFGTATAALAQATDTAPAPAPATSAGPAAGEEDIVVTAQRRQQNLRDIPASVTALSEETLEAAHVTSIHDLVRVTPGLKTTSPFSEGGAPNFNIRGIQTIDYTANQSKPVALYVNEGIRGLSIFEIMPIYDIERVEVLKGPQGTLYGKNASAGAINIITRRPGFNTEAEVTLGYGNYDRREIRGAAQAVLVDDVLAVRGAFYAVKADGFVKNLFRDPRGIRGIDPEGTDQLAGRLSLRYTPTADFEALLHVHSTAVDGTGANVHAGYRIRTDLTGGVDRTGLGYYEESRDGPGLDRVRNNGVNLNLKYEMGGISLVSISTYDDGSLKSASDYDGLPRAIAHSYYTSDDADQFSQEIRIQSIASEGLNWLVGAQYVWDSTDFSVHYDLSESVLGVSYGNDVSQERNSYAVFARAEAEILSGLTIFGGGRYSRDTVSGELSSASSDFASDPYDGRTINTPQLVDLTQREKAKNFSAEAGVSYKPTNDLMFFASYKEGYRGPALNSQAFFSPLEFNAVKAETTSSYEVGAKVKASRWLQLNAAMFQTSFRDQQYLSDENADGVLVIRLLNAPKSRSRGAEAEVYVFPVEGVKLSYAGTYLDAKYRDFLVNGLQVSGDQLVGASKWSHYLAADWKFAGPSGGSVNLNANASYASRVYFTANNTDVASQPSMWLVNGRASWTSAQSTVTVGLWAQNIFNKRYWINVTEYPELFGYDLNTRGRPRTYGADVTFRF